MSQVVIENVGAIRHIAIPVAPGSVTVLEGRNGTGKTTALKAVEAVITGKNTGLTPSDGRKNGSVEFSGAVCRIGLRFSAKGEMAEPVIYIDSADAVRTFINPGIKNPEAADRRRIEAMIEMTGATCTAGEVQAFLGEKVLEAIPATERKKLLATPSLVEQVAGIKSLLEEKARSCENQVLQITGQLQQIPMEFDVAPVRDLSELQADLELTTERYIERKKKAEAATAAAAELAQFEKVDLAPIDAALLSAQEELNDQVARMAALESAISESRRKIDVLQAQRDTHHKINTRIEQLQQNLNDGSCGEQVESLRVDKERLTAQLQESLAHNAMAQQVAAKKDERLRLLRDREVMENRGEELRTKARGSYKLLADAVSLFDGWSVSEEMRLCCEHSRGLIYFAELSPGEQAIRALDLATRPTEHSAPGVTVVPQEIWESLDGVARNLILQWANERKIAVITAQCQQAIECPACLMVVDPGTVKCPGCDQEIAVDPIIAKQYGGDQ